MKDRIKKSPWAWIPTLYFAEGIPYFIVNSISVIMFTRMGMPKGDMAMDPSLLYLPWVIKPLWSPFVDIIKTKRWWVLSMQIVMSIAFALLAFSLPYTLAVTLFVFWITAFASATHDIAADGYYMLAMEPADQAAFVGIRSTFYRLSSIFGQGVLVMIAGVLENRMDNIPAAWSVTLIIASLMFSALTIWHIYKLPRPAADSIRNVGDSPSDIWGEIRKTFVTFFKKKNIWLAIVFMLLFRLPEAFLVKMMNPFLLDPIPSGGLGMSTEEVGFIYGTIGVAALTIGGILGGLAASRWGLKKSLWPMALSLALPCLSFVFLAIYQPESNWLISACVALDQFGYGFGFTAYMLYLMYFSEGEYKTAHYSLCTAFMALSMLLPGMVSGYIQESVGYVNFFIFVMICCIATVVVTSVLKVDPNYAKK